MTTDENRARLERLIDARDDLDLAKASRAISHHSVYLHQFIRYGKPAYLNEQDRATLETLLRCDLTFLKPPSKEPKSPKQPTAVQPDKGGRFVDEPEKLAILDLWDELLDEQDRLRLFRMLKAYAEPIPAKRG